MTKKKANASKTKSHYGYAPPAKTVVKSKGKKK